MRSIADLWQPLINGLMVMQAAYDFEDDRKWGLRGASTGDHGGHGGVEEGKGEVGGEVEEAGGAGEEARNGSGEAGGEVRGETHDGQSEQAWQDEQGGTAIQAGMQEGERKAQPITSTTTPATTTAAAMSCPLVNPPPAVAQSSWTQAPSRLNVVESDSTASAMESESTAVMDQVTKLKAGAGEGGTKGRSGVEEKGGE